MPYNPIYDSQFVDDKPYISLTKSPYSQGDLYTEKPLYTPDEEMTSGVPFGESDYDTPIDERSITDASFINRQRAFEQPEYAKGFNAVVGGIISGLATAVEDISYLADVENGVARLTGAQEVEQNWLGQAMQDFKKGLGETMPIYQEDPNKVWDWSDSGKYWSALKGVVDSAVGFGIPGMAAGKLVNIGMKGLRTNAILNGLITANRADKISALGAGFLTNYAEGKTMALEMFDAAMNNAKSKYYNDILSKYKDRKDLDPGQINALVDKEYKEGLANGKEEEFRKIAGAEADKFQRNNMVFMLTDAMALSGLFKAAKGGTRNPITKETMKDYFLGMNTNNFLVQGVKEGAEEIGQNVMQSEAEYQAAIKSGVVTNEPLDDFDRILKFATSDKALLEGAMGFFGGPVQRVFTKGISGQYGSKYNKSIEDQISSQEKQIKDNEDFFKTNFNTYKTANQIMAEAEANGNTDLSDALKKNVFSTVAANNFAAGTTEALENNIKEVMELTPEQAAEKGYKPSYKKDAEAMLSELKELEKDWNKSTAYSRPEQIMMNRQNRKLTNTTLLSAQRESNKARQEFINSMAAYGTDGVDLSPSAFDNLQFVADPTLNNIIVNSPEFQKYTKTVDQVKKASDIVKQLDLDYTTLTSREFNQKDFETAKKAAEIQKQVLAEQAEANKKKKAEADRKDKADKAKAKQEAAAKRKQNVSKPQVTNEPASNLTEEFLRPDKPSVEDLEDTGEVLEDTPEVKVATDVNPEARTQLNQMGYSNPVIDGLSREERADILTNGIPFEEYKPKTTSVEDEYTQRKAAIEKERDAELLKKDNYEYPEGSTTIPRENWADIIEEDKKKIYAVYNAKLTALDEEFSKKSTVSTEEATSSTIVNSTIELNQDQDDFSSDKEKIVDAEGGDIDKTISEINNQDRTDADGNLVYEYDRIKDGYNVLAYLSRKFKQAYNALTGNVTRKDIDNVLNEELLDKKILSPNSYKAGTTLIIKLADEDTVVYDPDSKTKETTTWKDVLDTKGEGFVNSQEWLDRVPMAIYDVEGKKIAYLHEIGWISSQNIFGNVQENIENLRKIRQAVLDNNKELTVTVRRKSVGKLFKTADKSKVSVKEAMPDKNLKVGIGRNGVVVNSRSNNTIPAIANKKISDGITYAIAPMGETNLAIPLTNIPLTGNTKVINTILKAVEIFATKDSKNPIVAQIYKELNINITTAGGIQAFITMFINNSKTVDGKFVGKTSQGFVTIQSNAIKFGVGGSKIDVNFISQGTDAKVLVGLMKKLSDTLNKAYSNISLDNLAGKALYIEDGGITTESYLDYVKSVTETNILSANIGTEENPEYTYFLQPIIELSVDDIISKPAKEEEVTTEPIVKEDAAPETATEPAKKTVVPKTKKIQKEKLNDDLLPMTEQDRDSLKESARTVYAAELNSAVKQNQIIRHVKGLILQKLFKSTEGINLNEELQSILDSYKQYQEDAKDDVKAFTEAGELEEAKDYQEVVDEVQKVIDSWEVISRLTKEAIAKINNVQVDIESDEELDSDEITNPEKFDSDRALTMDGITKLSVKVKRMLGGIKDINSKGEVITNYLNQEVYVPFDEAYNTLQMLTSDLEPSLKAIINKLEEHKGKIPWLSQVITMLKEADSDVQNGFVKGMTNHTHNMKFVMWGKDKNGKFNLIEYNANSNSLQETIKGNWRNALLKSDIGVYMADGNIKGNSEAIKKAVEVLDSLDKEDLLGLQSWLSSIGFDMSMEALQHIKNEVIRNNTYEGQFKNANGLFRVLKENLLELSDRVIDDTNFFSDSAIKLLVKIQSEYSKSVTSNSFRAGTKTIFSYGNNKHLVSEIRRLKEVVKVDDNTYISEVLTELSDTNFTKHSLWLKDMMVFDTEEDKIMNKPKRVDGKVVIDINSSTFQNLGHAVVSLEALKEMGAKSKDNAELHKLSPMEIEVFKLGMLQAARADASNKGNRIINITYPTSSDKTTVMMLQAVAFDATYDFEGNLTEETYDKLYDIFVLPELTRIATFQSLDDSKRPNNSEYSGTKGKFDGGANKFIFFPEFNNIAGLFDSQGRLSSEAENVEFKQKFKEVIKKYIDSLVAEKLDFWNEVGIGLTSDVEGNKVVNSFLRNEFVTNKKVGNNPVKYAATDMVLQYLVANAESFKVFIGDPAQFWKPKNKTGEITQQIKDTFENIGKRLAADIAPGTDLAESEDDNYIQIFMDDYKAVSKEYEKRLAKILNEEDRKPYGAKKFDSTDAQEYTTWREHLKILRMEGRITDAQYNSISVKLADGKKLSHEEVGVVLQPIKPVYVANVNTGGDLRRRVYIKSSSFPLIKQLTNGLEIDKLRLAMEELEDSQQKTVRAAYKTAVKVGCIANTAKVWDKDGNITKGLSFLPKKDKEGNDIAPNWLVLNRRGFRIQQDVPYDPSKSNIREVTQASKNLFINMLNIGGFKVPWSNKEFTGAELKKEYDNLHGELYKIGLENLKAKLLTEQGLISIEKLRQLVNEEAIKRNYNISERLLIELDKELKFLPFSAVASKYQAILNALVYDNVLKQKIHGKSFVLGSSQGFKKDVTVLNSVKDVSGIVFTDTFDKEIMPTGENPDGSIKLAQVILPWKFKDNFGNKLDINNFINPETGRIDFNKLPKNLLEGFGMRIPNQGPNSQAAFEIVGFLPEANGDLIIAPEDWVVQMGSDFDVDKLYTYLYNSFYYRGTLNSNFPSENEIEAIQKTLEGKISSIKKDLSLLKLTNKSLSDDIDKLFESLRVVKDLTLSRKDRKSLQSWEESELADLALEIERNKDIKESLKVELYELIGLQKVLDNSIKYNIQNKIIDIHLAIHKNNNKDIQEAISKPLGTWLIEDTASKIVEVKSKRNSGNLFSGISESYQTMKFIQATAGKIGVGKFSLDSMFNAVAQGTGLAFPNTEKNPFRIAFGNNISIGKLSNEKTLDGKFYISDVIAGYQSASVDNEKLQVLDKLNINNDTFNIITLLNQLGFGEEVLYFISQDIIFDYIKELQRLRGKLGEYVGNADALAYSKIISNPKYVIPEGTDLESYSEPDLTKLKDLVLYDTLPVDYAKYQRALLDKFISLQGYADTLSDTQRGVNIDSKGFGKSILESNLKEEQIMRILFSGVKNSERLFGDVLINPEESRTELEAKGYIYRNYKGNRVFINPTTIPGMAVVYGLFSNNDLWNQVFPTNDDIVTQIFEEVEVISNLEDRGSFNKKSDTRFNVWNAMKSYMFTSVPSLYEEDINSRRAFLLKDTVNSDNVVTHKSLSTIVAEVKQGRLKNNSFIQRLFVRTEKNSPIKLIEYKSSAKEGVDETRVFVDFLDLFINEKVIGIFNNQEYTTTKLAQELVEYSFITGGIQEAIEFLKVIPPAYLKQIGLIDYISSVNLNNTTLFGTIPMGMKNKDIPYYDRVSNFTTQYFQHNPFAIKEVIPAYLFKEFGIAKKNIPATLDLRKFNSVEANSFKQNIFRLYAGTEDPVPPIFIRVYVDGETALYKFNGTVYTRIPLLGTFGSSEYNSTTTTQVSSLKGDFKVPVETFNKPIPNPNKLTTFDRLKIKATSDGKNQLKEILTEISKDSSFNGQLATIFASNLDSIEDFAIELTDNSLAFGRWNGKRLLLNTQANKTYTKEQITNKLLHEVTHIFTVGILNQYLNKDGELDVSKIQDAAVRKQLVALNSALRQYKNHLELTDKAGFEAFKKKYELLKKANSGDEQAASLYYESPLTDEENKYYAAVNIKEFVAQALGEPEFQTILNSIPDVENTSLWGRLKQAIAKLLSYIVDIEEGSLLYTTVLNTLDLISPTSEATINIYAGTNENAELSNFAIRPFTFKEPNGEEDFNFKSVEQGFQFFKTYYTDAQSPEQVFKLGEIQDKILNTTNGAELKKLGNSYPTLDTTKWDRDSSKIMKLMLLRSFMQNPDALQKLLATGNATLTHTQDKGKWGTEFPRLLMEVRDELRHYKPEPTTIQKDSVEYIYSQLGNKTQSEHAVHVVLPEDLGLKYEGGHVSNMWRVIAPKFKAKYSNGVIAYRGKVDNSAIGNPFSITNRGENTVKQFIEWIVTGNNFGVESVLMGGKKYVLNELRDEYLKIIKNSKGAKILYYRELGRPSHATALDYLINKYDWNTQNNNTNPLEYTDHSGGAAFSDTMWDVIGREFGMINFNHYREPGVTDLDSEVLRNAGVKPVNISSEDYQEGIEKATKAFRMMFTNSETKTVRSSYIIRNWAQVKYSDAIFAIGTIKQAGEKASDKKDDDRIAARPLVKGGTGYAVQMAINEGKPVYVYDGTKAGWYKYDYNIKNFVETTTPILTKNFAGIGSRTLSTQEVANKSIQAIRDVYENTFRSTKVNTEEVSNPITTVETFKQYGIDYQFTLNENNEVLNAEFKRGGETEWSKLNSKNWESKYQELKNSYKSSDIVRDFLDDTKIQKPSDEFKYSFTYKGVTIPTQFQLTVQQTKALERLIEFVLDGKTSKRDKAITLSGFAGTGKTSVIGYLQQYIEKSRATKSFAYMAPTHNASVELSMATVRTGNNTLALTVSSAFRTIKDNSTGQIIGREPSMKLKKRLMWSRAIFVVDEVSMLSSDDYKSVLEAIQSNSNYSVIFMGDIKQIPQVTTDNIDEETGAVLPKQVSKAFTDLEQIELTEVKRTSDEDILAVLTAMRNTKTDLIPVVTNTSKLQYLNSAEFEDTMVEKFLADPENSVAISYTNKGVAAYNLKVRKLLGRTGDLQKGDTIVGYASYNSKQVENQDIANSIRYTIESVEKVDNMKYVGHQITAKSSRLQTLADSGVKVSSTATGIYLQLSNTDNLAFSGITAEDMERNNQYLSQLFRKIYELKSNAMQTKRWSEYNSYQESLAKELSRINLGSKYMYNPKSGKMELYSKSLELSINKDFRTDLRIEEGIGYGHAVTIHKSQGSTYKNVFFDTSTLSSGSTKLMQGNVEVGSEKSSLIYVALSRASDNLYILKNNNSNFYDLKSTTPNITKPVTKTSNKPAMPEQEDLGYDPRDYKGGNDITDDIQESMLPMTKEAEKKIKELIKFCK